MEGKRWAHYITNGSFSRNFTNKGGQYMVKILWFGLDRKLGLAACQQSKSMDDVKIVGGVKQGSASFSDATALMESADDVQWFYYNNLGAMRINAADMDKVNMIVNFSSPSHFTEIVELAARFNKPLVTNVTGLSSRQQAMLYDLSARVPVFQGGIVSMGAKKFIDEAEKLARKNPRGYTLYENLYQGKSMPSALSVELGKRILKITGHEPILKSSVTLNPEDMVCEWKFDKLQYRTVGFDELAHDILRIAKIMAEKRAIRHYIYDIDSLWDDLCADAVAHGTKI